MKFPLLLLTAILSAAAVVAQHTEPLPKVVNLVDPAYPDAALGLALGGKIKAIVKVDKHSHASIESIMGPLAPCSDRGDDRVAQLRQAAKDAINRSNFEAAVDDKGKPVDSYAMITYKVPPVRDRTDKGAKLVQGGVINGKAISLPKPAYPSAAHAERAGGPVSVEVLIDESGTVIGAAAISGHRDLLNSAMDAACSAKFSPTLLAGQPVKVSGVITYNFVP